MAKKPTFRELYERRSAYLADQKRRQNETYTNREQEALGIIESIEADGTVLSDDQKAQILNQFVRTGKFDFAAQPEAPVLPQTTPTTTGRGIDTATYVPTSEARPRTSQSIFDDIDTDVREFVSDQGANLRAAAREGLAGLMSGAAPVVNATINSPANLALAKKLGITLPQLRSPRVAIEEAARLRQEARDIRRYETSQRARMGAEVLADAEGFTGTVGALTNPTILADQASTQVGQLIGTAPGAVLGPQGFIAAQAVSAGGQSGEEAYQNVLAKGGTEEQAEAARTAAAGMSALVNFGGQRLIPKGGALEELLTGTVSKGVSRSATRAATAPLVGEAAAETLTEVLDQAAVNLASGDPWDQGLGKAAAMGLALGTAMGAGPAVSDARQSVANRRARATENEANILRNLPTLPETDPGSFVPTNEGQTPTYGVDQLNVDRELFNAEQDIRADEQAAAERDAAFSIREREEQLQREVEEEAAFRTMENQRRTGGLAEAMRGAGVNTTVTPEQVAAERIEADKARREQERLEKERTDRAAAEAARVKEINDVARRREAVAKAAAKKAEADNKKQVAATRAQRNAAIDKLMADNPNASDAEIADMLPAALQAMADAPKTPAKNTAAKKTVAPKAQTKTAPTDREINAELRNMGFRNLSSAGIGDIELAIERVQARKAGPKPTPAAKPAAKTAATVEALKATGDAADSFAAEAMTKLGLGMKGKANDAKASDFATKAREIGRALAGNSSRQAAAVEDLVRQGKLIIAPSAKDVGRADNGNVGEYDLSDGKMYVYADKLSDNPVADIIEAASHESGHAGTFNQREGRSAVMRSLVGDEKVIAAADKLRKSNHKFAVDAKAKAEADSKERGDNQYEDAEIVGYFIGNVAAARNTALGTVGGVVRDLISGARDVVRNKLGVDLDISIGDLNTAASRVMEEVAATDTTGGEGEGSLRMIYPESAKGYEQALKDGRVYTSSQGNKQFVLSDADAKLKPDAAKKLASGVTMRLEEVMDHPVLFENMPAARDILIVTADGLGKSMAQYTPGTDVIEVSPALVEGRSPATLRDGILHETQHWVQDMSAAREGFITSNDRPQAEMDAVSRFEAANEANNAAARAVLDDAQKLVQGLTMSEKRAAMNVVTDTNLPLHRRAQELIDMVGTNADGNANVDAFQNSLDEYREAAKGFNAANRMQRARYLRNPTEAEAFFTQANSRTAQEDLPINPETDPDYGTEVMASMGNRNSLGMKRKPAANESQVVPGRRETDAEVKLRKVYEETGREWQELANIRKQRPLTDFEWARVSKLSDQNIAAAQEYNARRGVDEILPIINYLTDAPTTLGMAARNKNNGALRNKNKFATALVSQLRNDKGLGKFVRNEVELAKAAPAEFEAQANRAVGKYDDALEKLAADRGVTTKELNNEIRDALEEVYAQGGTPSEKAAAFRGVVGKYGDAGQALIELRNLVDGLSTDLVKAYIDSGAKLTPAEKKDLEKVIGNMGGYVHRFYAAYQGKPGKEYAKAVRKAVAKAEKKGESSLNEAQKELLDRYRNAATVVLDGIRIPDEAEIDSLSPDTLDYLYETWISTNHDSVPREQKIEELLARREEIGPEELDSKTEAALEALLGGAEEASSVKYYRGQKLDTGIMQKRKKIPKEIRELMGEVTDPAAALLVTVSKQAEYVARTKMMLALKDMADPNDLQPPGSEGTAIVRANNMKPLKGEAYGPLNGWYASPSMEAMIGDTRESLQNFTEAAIHNDGAYEGLGRAVGNAVVKAWMKGAGGAKAASIVGNLFRYPLNALGAYGMLGTNGNIDPRTWAQGMKDAGRIIRYAYDPGAGLTPTAAAAVKYRVVDSATVGDLKLLDRGKVERVIKEMSGKSPGWLARNARKLGLGAREVYAMMDVWSKIANFHFEVNALRAIYAAEGAKKTDDEIYREASDIVNQTNISYQRAAPFIKAVERAGITQFGPYLYEAHRATLANLYVGTQEIYRAKDFTNPKAKALMAARGTARIVGTGGFMTATYLLSRMAAGLFGDNEEEKRALLPEYSRNMDFVQVGTDSEGKPILYAASNLDPVGPLTDLIRAARRGEQPLEAVWDQFKESYIAPALGPKLYDAGARTANEYLGWGLPTLDNRPRKPLIAQWSPGGWSATAGQMDNPDVARAWANLVETRYLPGTARAWSDNNPIAADGSVSGTAYNIARALGARGVHYDPQRGATNAGFEYKAQLDDLRSNLKNYIDNADGVTVEALTGRVLELRQRELEAANNLYKAYRGAVSVGMTDADFAAAAKQAKVSATALNSVMSGDYTSQVISEDSIKAGAEREMRGKSQAEQEKIQAKWNTAWDILQQLQGGQ